MTTGRINQVTTFPIRFRGCHLLACDPIAHFRDSEFIRPTSKTHRSSRTPSPRNEVQASLNPQMASPHFPLSHVSGEIPFSDMITRVSHLPLGLPATGDASKAHTVTTDPQVASCIRFDHRQAIHPPSTSLKCNSHKERLSHQRGLLERRANLIRSNPLSTPSSPHQRKGPTGNPTRSPFEFLSTLSPYSRNPSPFGANTSIHAKGVSRGVHNIAPSNFSPNPSKHHCPSNLRTKR